MYGEEDHLFFPTLAKVTNKFGGVIPKILGAGGKHQMTYVGMCTFLLPIAMLCKISTQQLTFAFWKLQETWHGLTFLSNNRWKRTRIELVDCRFSSPTTHRSKTLHDFVNVYRAERKHSICVQHHCIFHRCWPICSHFYWNWLFWYWIRCSVSSCHFNREPSSHTPDRCSCTVVYVPTFI